MASCVNGGEMLYVQSYENLQVHELMLRDDIRTRAYAQFISDNQEMFVNKIVVDVGAGSGILSLFAAKAGAKQVFAIEASAISEVCTQLVVQNHLDERITVIRGCVENVQLPGNIKADILISEWMGFYLLHESMLTSVIIARDRFLSPDGVMVPSAASLYVCPVSMKQYHERNITYWNNVYGFDFSPVANAIRQSRASQPNITTVPATECLAEPRLIVRLELTFLGVDEIKNITGMPTFTIAKNDVLRGFACWFDVEFEGTQHSLVLSTAPGQPDTHWSQTVLMLPDALLVSKGDEISCNLLLSQDAENSRRYNITVEVPDDDDNDDDDAKGVDDETMVVDRDDQMEREYSEHNHNDDLEAIIRNTMSKST